ncbi:MAG: sensor histidine kinase [Terracidiphilus sp.]|jgi:signal transduction histidine kinase
MQEIEQTAVLSGTDRRRVEAVVETLAKLGNKGESLAEVAHDARNMVTALGLYCDLLEEPGVLAAPFLHYGSELKLVAAASRRLVEKLMILDSREPSGAPASGGTAFQAAGLSRIEPIADQAHREEHWGPLPATLIDDLAQELRSNRNLLAALAGTAFTLTLDASTGALPVRLTGEDLTRILVNLVKNAVEVMPAGGRIHLSLRESPTEPGADPWLTLNIEDNGPGIPRGSLESIFEAGYTNHAKAAAANGTATWRSEHRGLGLSITRSIVEGAGGRISAANRDPSGACFQIELPVRTR